MQSHVAASQNFPLLLAFPGRNSFRATSAAPSHPPVAMAGGSSGSKGGEKSVAHFLVGKEKFRVGDTVALRPPSVDASPFIAKIVDIKKKISSAQLRVRVCWYYRPEEARGGRKGFHGSKELFTSDHEDWVTPDAVNGKCEVHSLREFQLLDDVYEFDFFTRFVYHAARGEFKPDRVPVYCLCEMPFNPDVFMVECEGCSEWHHPSCIQLTQEEVQKMAHFVCAECTKHHLKKGTKGKVRKRYSEDDAHGPVMKRSHTGGSD